MVTQQWIQLDRHRERFEPVTDFGGVDPVFVNQETQILLMAAQELLDQYFTFQAQGYSDAYEAYNKIAEVKEAAKQEEEEVIPPKPTRAPPAHLIAGPDQELLGTRKAIFKPATQLGEKQGQERWSRKG